MINSIIRNNILLISPFGNRRFEKKFPIKKCIEIKIPTLQTNIQMLLAIKKKNKPIINHGSNNFIINARIFVNVAAASAYYCSLFIIPRTENHQHTLVI